MPAEKLERVFAESSGLLVDPVNHPGIIECPYEDCGAPCNKIDVSDDGECRYCGGDIIALLDGKPDA